MRKTIPAILFVAAACCPVLAGKVATPPGNYLTWTRLPELPDADTHADRLGRAGMFAGVHNDALILAGGANFPTDRLKGGKKTYYKDIFVLVKAGEGDADALGEVSPDGKSLPKGPRYKWIRPDVTLDRDLAYGVAIPTDAGLVCIGGEWQVHGDKGTETFFSDKVFVLTWDQKTRTLAKTDRLVSADEEVKGKAGAILPLPPLPEACSCMAGAKVGDVIYIAGGKRTRESGGKKKTCSTEASGHWTCRKRLTRTRSSGSASTPCRASRGSWPSRAPRATATRCASTSSAAGTFSRRRSTRRARY